MVGQGAPGGLFHEGMTLPNQRDTPWKFNSEFTPEKGGRLEDLCLSYWVKR